MSDFKLSNDPIVKLDENSYYCKIHPYAFGDSFVEVTNKKTNTTMIRCGYCENIKEENKKLRAEEWQKEKENITPYYVRRILTTGRNIKMHQIPDELVEVKTAVIQLNRLKEKIDAPIKVCSRHGNLYENAVIKAGKNKSGEQKYKCKACMSSIHARNYQLNKVKIAIRCAKYRSENKEKVRAQKQKSYMKYQISYLDKHIIDNAYLRHKIEERLVKKKAANKRDQDELTNHYVKRKIAYRTGLKSADIPEELVEAKRAVMVLNRGIRRKRDEFIFNYIEEKENGKR